MKKLLFLFAIFMAFTVSAKNGKSESNFRKPFCFEVNLITSCGLNEKTWWCPEYGDTIDCLMNEWDSYDFVYCREH